MKRIVAFIAIAVVVLSAWLVHSRLERSRREVAHRAALAPYQRDLPIDISRADVDKYLASIKATHLTGWDKEPADGPSYLVLLGEEPGDGFVCDHWNIYVSLKFKSSSGSRERPLPSDTLREIHIEQIGHCL